MKKLIKSIFIPLLLSTIIGFVSARFIFKIYEEDINNRFSSSKIYLLQNGEYDSYEQMRQENNGTSYVYYEDEEDKKYKSVIGITKNIENIKKIKELYNNDLKVEEYYVGNDLLNEKLTDYDKQLSVANDELEVISLVNNILNLYKEDETIKLILTK